MSSALAAYEAVPSDTDAKDWTELMKSYGELEGRISNAKSMKFHVDGAFAYPPYFSGQVTLPLSAKDEAGEKVFKERFSTDLLNAADELEKRSYWDVWKGTFRHYLGLRGRLMMLPIFAGGLTAALVSENPIGNPLAWICGAALGTYTIAELFFSNSLKNYKREAVQDMRKTADSIEVLYVQDSFSRKL